MNVTYLPVRPVRDPLDAAIALHGPFRVLLAATRALLRPRARPPDLNRVRDLRHLPNHIRRDIGLLPTADAPNWTRFPN